MPTFIKTGFWEKLSKAPKEYLNLDNLIQSIGGGGTPYKKYVAFLSQESINPPVATVLENTLGGDVTFTYVSTGEYLVNLPITGNVWISMTNNSSGSSAILEYETLTNQPINSFRIRTNEFSTGSPADINLNDSCLYYMSIEIRVYP